MEHSWDLTCQASGVMEHGWLSTDRDTVWNDMHQCSIHVCLLALFPGLCSWVCVPLYSLCKLKNENMQGGPGNKAICICVCVLFACRCVYVCVSFSQCIHFRVCIYAARSQCMHLCIYMYRIHNVHVCTVSVYVHVCMTVCVHVC